MSRCLKETSSPLSDCSVLESLPLRPEFDDDPCQGDRSQEDEPQHHERERKPRGILRKLFDELVNIIARLIPVVRVGHERNHERDHPAH